MNLRSHWWLKLPESLAAHTIITKNSLEIADVKADILRIFKDENKGRYGYRRITLELKKIRIGNFSVGVRNFVDIFKLRHSLMVFGNTLVRSSSIWSLGWTANSLRAATPESVKCKNHPSLTGWVILFKPIKLIITIIRLVRRKFGLFGRRDRIFVV